MLSRKSRRSAEGLWLPANKTWTFYSSSEDATDADRVWIFSLGSGNLSSYTNDSARHLWAVRGGN